MTKMTPIDVPRALELLELCVVARGTNYLYEPPSVNDPCAYWNTRKGEPDCMIGLALHLHGVPVGDIQALDTHGNTMTTIGSVTANALHKFLPYVSEHASSVFHVAQLTQDVARPWGDALEEARKYAVEVGYKPVASSRGIAQQPKGE